jgi:hypothetical protein
VTEVSLVVPAPGVMRLVDQCPWRNLEARGVILSECIVVRGVRMRPNRRPWFRRLPYFRCRLRAQSLGQGVGCYSSRQQVMTTCLEREVAAKMFLWGGSRPSWTCLVEDDMVADSRPARDARRQCRKVASVDGAYGRGEAVTRSYEVVDMIIP